MNYLRKQFMSLLDASFKRVMVRATVFCAFTICLSLSSLALGQISIYKECSLGLEEQQLGQNLTAEERLAVMDERFQAGLADIERCEVGGGGGGGSDAGSGAGASGSAVSGPFISGVTNSQVDASPNAASPKQVSVPLSSELQPIGSAPADDSSDALQIQSELGSNGRKHEALATTNNQEALAKGLLARAERENDPEVKELLMERYRELK